MTIKDRGLSIWVAQSFSQSWSRQRLPATAVCGGLGGRRRYDEIGGPTEDPYRGREEGREADVVHHLDCRSGGAAGERGF